MDPEIEAKRLASAQMAWGAPAEAAGTAAAASASTAAAGAAGPAAAAATATAPAQAAPAQQAEPAGKVRLARPCAAVGHAACVAWLLHAWAMVPLRCHGSIGS